ncbi:MAG: DUF4153 domain-containing protein [Alphaproteobacteria bacterium]|nr:DUF4153 domain-containing protein [Alphaproteobacteria bacterium]
MITQHTNKIRVAIGFAQGLMLFALHKAAVTGTWWPGTDALSFSALLMMVVMVPPLLITGYGQMRTRSLFAWGLCAAVLLAGLAMYDVSTRGGVDVNGLLSYREARQVNAPSFMLVFFAAVGFCIAHTLIMAGDAERKYISSYPRYFDTAWKLAVQVILSGVFVGLFWGVLILGSALFNLIKIKFISDLIEKEWFYYPATAMAFAYALHVTDVRGNLVRSIRTLKLTLFSWLLPLMALFGAGFLIALPFQGLEHLWSTRYASVILLAAAAWLIVLINAAYQDGTPEHAPPKILRYAGSLASVLLLPLVVIAAYAISLRVEQYGWTANLIQKFACVIVGMCYAVGYLWAAIIPHPWLRKLERTNILAALLTLAVLLALFTPIADPARLSVTSQIGRLEKGEVSPDKFDYVYLAKEGEIYGTNALKKLEAAASGPQAELIKKKVSEALLSKNSPRPLRVPLVDVTDITVYPKGRNLPESFTRQVWDVSKVERWEMPSCLYNIEQKCEAFLIDGAKGVEFIILMDVAAYGNSVIFHSAEGGWKNAGRLWQGKLNCKGIREALRSKPFKMVPSGKQELEVDGIRIPFKPDDKCP